MLKICTRIIALFAACCLVAVSCPFAWASDGEYVAQHTPTVWEHIIDSSDSAMRKLFNGVVGTFVGMDYCAFTDSGKHQGTEVVSKSVGSDGEYVFYIRCTGCGKTFAYKGSDAQNQYNNAVHDNNLDSGGRITPSDESGTARYYLVHDDDSARSWPNCSSSYINEYWSGWSNGKYYFSGTAKATYYDSALLYIFLSPPSFVSDNAISTYAPNLSSSGFQFEKSLPNHFPLVGEGCITTIWFYMDYVAGTYCSVSFDNPYVLFNVPDSAPSVPSTITINNNTYPVIDLDFSKREFHIEDNRTIIYDDDKIIIKEGDTVIEEHNYYIEDDDNPSPGPGDDSSSNPDPGTVDPGDGSGSGGSGCCEKCQLLLRQVNEYLLQIQTLVVQINDKLGSDSDNYMQGIYNLLVEINNALDALPTEPHKDYEDKLNLIANQLANIWGDLETIKTSLSAVETNTATTNDKLDTVHDDLEAVLAELQEQKGILQQILDTLKKILGHVTSIDSNVEELNTEEKQQNFLSSFIGKFGFINDIYRITVQMMRDVTSDAVSAQAVSDGIIPTSVLTASHSEESPEETSEPFNSSGASTRSLALSRSGGTAPEIKTSFPDVEVLGFNLSNYSAIDLSWYAPYKSEVDTILSGFMYLGYLWLLFKRLPSIVQGGAVASSDYIDVSSQLFNRDGD